MTIFKPLKSLNKKNPKIKKDSRINSDSNFLILYSILFQYLNFFFALQVLFCFSFALHSLLCRFFASPKRRKQSEEERTASLLLCIRSLQRSWSEGFFLRSSFLLCSLRLRRKAKRSVCEGDEQRVRGAKEQRSKGTDANANNFFLFWLIILFAFW